LVRFFQYGYGRYFLLLLVDSWMCFRPPPYFSATDLGFFLNWPIGGPWLRSTICCCSLVDAARPVAMVASPAGLKVFSGFPLFFAYPFCCSFSLPRFPCKFSFILLLFWAGFWSLLRGILGFCSLCFSRSSSPLSCASKSERCFSTLYSQHFISFTPFAHALYLGQIMRGFCTEDISQIVLNLGDLDLLTFFLRPNWSLLSSCEIFLVDCRSLISCIVPVDRTVTAPD